MKGKYYFIGIGGVSMSALARLLLSKGNEVWGSDVNTEVKLEGIQVFHKHSAKNMRDADFVIYNSAIPENNPEIAYAKKHNIPLFSRAELLGKIASEYKHTISISGAHGKTTTTEMIAEVFIQAGLDPTVHIGGISNSFNSNLRIGGKKYFITEACEYKDSFLSLKSDTGVILNIEPEHMDYFKTFDRLKSSFQKFANNSKNVVAPYPINSCKTLTFKDGKNFYAKDIKKLETGEYSFDCFYKNKKFDTYKLNAIGIHNIDNALACISVAYKYKISKKHIRTALANFRGVKRRMEILSNDPVVIHDYAHHPTEIQASISAVKSHYGKELIVVFQPHTFSRTKQFWNEFINAFKKPEKVFFFKTYPARENPIKNASAQSLYEELKKNRKNVFYYEDFKEMYKKIKQQSSINTVLLILGAGDIDKFAKYF